MAFFKFGICSTFSIPRVVVTVIPLDIYSCSLVFETIGVGNHFSPIFANRSVLVSVKGPLYGNNFWHPHVIGKGKQHVCRHEHEIDHLL